MRHPYLTDALDGFFEAEIANEKDGGDSPSTLDSAFDSLLQGGLDTFGLSDDDLMVFLRLVRIYGWNWKLASMVR